MGQFYNLITQPNRLMQEYVLNITDQEKRKYLVSAYEQETQKSFRKFSLFSYLSDMTSFLQASKKFEENVIDFRKKGGCITTQLLKNNQISPSYKAKIPLDTTLENIFDGIQKMKDTIKPLVEEGHEIYTYAQDNISLKWVGIIPQYKQEGYIFIPSKQSTKLSIYRYNMINIVHGNEKCIGINMKEFKNVDYNTLTTQPQHIRAHLIKTEKSLPTPATILINTDSCLEDFPINETILPIVKRSLPSFILNS